MTQQFLKLWRVRIVLAESVLKMYRLVTGNRLWFGGRWWDPEDVLVDLARHYGITINADGWFEELFSCTYDAYHQKPRYAGEWVAKQGTIKEDVERWYTRNALPMHACAMRGRIVSPPAEQRAIWSAVQKP